MRGACTAPTAPWTAGFGELRDLRVLSTGFLVFEGVFEVKLLTLLRSWV